jgi:hypothetical protein
MDVHSIALAAHSSGGRVLAQVRRVGETGSPHPRHVRIPGIMVDAVVTAPEQLQFHGLGYDATNRADPARVPEDFRPLLPLAMKWGVGDDGARGRAELGLDLLGAEPIPDLDRGRGLGLGSALARAALRTGEDHELQASPSRHCAGHGARARGPRG